MDQQVFFKDVSGQNIYLTFTPELFSPHPDHVLIVPIYQGQLLFTRHVSRGWELPGGKIEQGETAVEAAIRETWEETGATIASLVQIGEYRVETKDEGTFTKAIFLADVLSLGEIPEGFETVDAALFPIDVEPNQEHFSPFMKDQVFTSIQRRLGTGLPPAT